MTDRVQPATSAEGTPGHWIKRRAGGAAVMIAVIAAFYLLREHWGHLFGTVPYALLLACPLMHLFMHHGHGRRHGSGANGAGG